MSTDHLEEGELQALLDGELSPTESADALRHVGSCRECGKLYDELREASATLSAALALLDDRVSRSRPALIPPSVTRRRSWGAIPLGKAAVLLVLCGAAASATIPGSPLREWISGRFAAPVTVAVDQQPGHAERTTAFSAEQPVEAGTAAAPDLGRLRIVLTRPERGMIVRVLLTDGASGGAYLVGDSASAQFDGTTGRVEVIDAAGGQLRVEIPRTATSASVEVDGRVYLVKEGDSVRLTTPGSQTAGDLEFRIE